MRQIIQHFTDNDAYTFSCQYYIMQTYPRAEVEYTFFDRNDTIYPKGFAELLNEQLGYMPNVIITEEEIDFMKKRMYYLPQWYFTFLRGYRFNPHELTVTQDEEGHLDIKVRGKWYSTIMWEMPILSIVSELMHHLQGDITAYNPKREYERCVEKTHKILSNGLILSDMGTRRRMSFDHHNMVIRTMKEVYEQGGFTDNHGFHPWTGRFAGTSNVYLAMQYDLVAIGTMSHQIIEFEECVSGIFECNFNVMRKFSDVYDGDNGIYLYDCFGDKVFFSNLSKRMAMMFNGLRVDSGVEEEQVEKIIAKYKSLGIDPATKQVVFSNGLNIDRAIEIHNYVDGRVK
ncbi:nicotinate phosphoribosyltransferase, partial [Prevotella aurantiaca]|uniref:nicotinate phosphoribosyltransferase n=1 Tax=Prevotella aurantiaca TaxID=596085 RepID=UPI002352D5CA